MKNVRIHLIFMFTIYRILKLNRKFDLIYYACAKETHNTRTDGNKYNV